MNAKNAVRKWFSETVEHERKLYEEKLQVVKDRFHIFKRKMDKVRFTKEIEDAVKKIKITREELNRTKQHEKTVEEEKNKAVAAAGRGKKDCRDLAVTDPGD